MNTNPVRPLADIDDLYELSPEELRAYADPDCFMCHGDGFIQWTEWEPYGMTEVPRFETDICLCIAHRWEREIE